MYSSGASSGVVSEAGVAPDVSTTSPTASPFVIAFSDMLAVAAESTETLFWRSDTEWLRVNAPPFQPDAMSSGSSEEVEVVVTAPLANGDEVSVRGYLGYRTGATDGAELYVSAVPVLDTHDANDPTWCTGMYFYSDAATSTQHSTQSLGLWSATADNDCATSAPASGSAVALFTRATPPLVSAAASCRQHLDSDPEALSGLYVLSTTVGQVEVWCDMERSSDGGGWTVLYSATGADNEVPLTSNVEVVEESPLGEEFVSYNLPQSLKSVFSERSSETMLWRSQDEWIVVDAPVFGQGPALADGTTHDFPVHLRSNVGDEAAGRMGFAAGATQSGWGGDFGLIVGEDAEFDGVSSHAPMKNLGCLHQLVSSHSPLQQDGDHGYAASATWSTWRATTTGCGPDTEGGSLGFRVAVRDRPPACPAGFHLTTDTTPHRCVGVLLETGPVTAGTAAAACAVEGGTLAVVDSATTNVVVRDTVAALGDAWLGLSDAAVEGVALWPDGRAATWVNWAAASDGVLEGDEARDCTLLSGADGSWSAQECAGVTAYAACSVSLCTLLVMAGCVDAVLDIYCGVVAHAWA